MQLPSEYELLYLYPCTRTRKSSLTAEQASLDVLFLQKTPGGPYTQKKKEKEEESGLATNHTMG